MHFEYRNIFGSTKEKLPKTHHYLKHPFHMQKFKDGK